MDAAQRELNDQIDQATQRLLDDARTIPEADLRAPSLLPGWTRAHVLAHVARGADAMRNLLAGARSGQDRPAYPSAQAREAGIEQGAVMRAEDLMADLASSAMALRAMVKQLPDEAWTVRVRMLDSAPFPAAGLLTRRLVEVELHHCDLGTGYSPADWPAAFATMELAEPMQSQRQDRLRHPPPSPGAKPAFPGRSPAPWKPGQRLPGSWLGTGNESRPLPTLPGPRAIPVRDDAADATVALGRRLLQKVFGHRDEAEPLPGPLADLVPDPGDSDALAACRLEIRRVLAADPVLESEVRSMLAGAPLVSVQVHAGRDAYTAGHDQVVVNYRRRWPGHGECRAKGPALAGGRRGSLPGRVRQCGRSGPSTAIYSCGRRGQGADHQ